MFFRKNKAALESAIKTSSNPDSSVSLFLTGDARKDTESLDCLLAEVTHINELVARVSGPDDLEALLNHIVDASIKNTGAERGLLPLNHRGRKRARQAR